jgi:3-phenylpropionate/trans-cinnamate dioxygenase ferredoxin component
MRDIRRSRTRGQNKRKEPALRRTRVAVCRTDEITPDTGKVCALGADGGECLLVFHQGRYHAVGSLCPHQNSPLNGAAATANEVICRRHGYRFDLKTGECRTVSGYGLPVYQVDVTDDIIYVSYWEFE